jgi:Protein of unknown function (DUF2892)
MNLELWERVIRIGVGIALLSLIFILNSSWKWLSLVGLVPLATGVIGWCPVYAWYAQD